MKFKRKLLGMAASVATMAVILSTVSKAQAGSGQPSVASLLSAVSSADAEMKALAVEKVSPQDVRLVNVASIANDGNRATIQRAIAKNAGPIGEMREALQKNPIMMQPAAKTTGAANLRSRITKFPRLARSCSCGRCSERSIPRCTFAGSSFQNSRAGSGSGVALKTLSNSWLFMRTTFA